MRMVEIDEILSEKQTEKSLEISRMMTLEYPEKVQYLKKWHKATPGLLRGILKEKEGGGILIVGTQL